MRMLKWQQTPEHEVDLSSHHSEVSTAAGESAAREGIVLQSLPCYEMGARADTSLLAFTKIAYGSPTVLL